MQLGNYVKRNHYANSEISPVSIGLPFVTVALAERNLRECLCVTITIDVIYQTQEQCFIEISQKKSKSMLLKTRYPKPFMVVIFFVSIW